MHLASTRLENFRLAQDWRIELGRRLTLLVGENGAGKTAIMDGLAIALGEVATYLPSVSGIGFNRQGDLRQADNQLAPYARVSVATPDGLGWDRTLRRDKSRSTVQQIPPGIGVQPLHRFLDENVLDPSNAGPGYILPVFSYYGVNRSVAARPPLRRRNFPEAYQRFQALEGALSAETSFRSAFIWFYNKENEEHRLQKERRDFDVTLPELDAVRRAIEAVFPDVEAPQMTVNPLRFVVWHHGEWLDILNLSDGYKTLLGLVIDLSVRMANANPGMKNPLEADALVMIDEIDLHLHPSWQRRVVGDLMAAFPNAQFVLSTHSPYIVESVNNHLKRYQVGSLTTDQRDLQALMPLAAAETRAYFTRRDGVQEGMDGASGLLHDHLLGELNAVGQTYDRLRDLEWEQGA